MTTGTTADRFRNKNGDLSVYALACGYLQVREKGGIEYRLWHEGACFHVRAVNSETRERIFWYSTEKLGAARKVFRTGKMPEVQS